MLQPKWAFPKKRPEVIPPWTQRDLGSRERESMLIA